MFQNESNYFDDKFSLLNLVITTILASYIHLSNYKQEVLASSQNSLDVNYYVRQFI